jgi:hypothetical protein
MIVYQQRRLIVTPPSPALQAGEHLRRSSDESFAVNKVESVLEINFKKGKARLPMLMQNVTERVSHSLHPSRTTHPKVLPMKLMRNLTFPAKTETFRNQSPKRVATAQRPNTLVWLS